MNSMATLNDTNYKTLRIFKHYWYVTEYKKRGYRTTYTIDPDSGKVTTLVTLNTFGQSSNSIEETLLKEFKKITYWAYYKGDTDTVDKYDSLEKANENFRKLLLKHTAQSPSTLTTDFKEIVNEGLSIATSTDGLFRIYSWDTYTGGTMHIFDNVYQYKVNGRVFSKTLRESEDEHDPGYWYSTIYSLTNAGKTFYLGLRHGIYSTKDSYQGIKSFSISNNSLNAGTKLIKTNTGVKNILGFEFDFFSVVHHLERPVRLITYNATTKTLTLPIVLENGEVTERRIIYQFTGRYFERRKL
jgi:hypothetical protein